METEKLFLPDGTYINIAVGNSPPDKTYAIFFPIY